ncbi:isochorismatase family protein [Hyphomonas adhaerens MHS-3]|uniref:Isochorismatase family protein n=2 Tax=Hyphomonas adhaerens TaxID=81029 RepID=A0A069E7X2_9PROT|nr:cysteine hydrolase [Hyphomonas adhaerens]KCZ86385.1 isochorismatase family protein [Hyphomonas adhaerens MHS-3]
MFGLKSSRKGFAAALAVAGAMLTFAGCASAEPAAGFQPDPARTAVLITDPQNDFMSEKGAAWGLVKGNVERLHTRENIAKLIASAKSEDVPLFVSPHYYFPQDGGWLVRGPIQQTLHDIHMFEVAGPVDYSKIAGTGADFYGPLKPAILDGETVIVSPHKIYGPESNDLVMQLRKHGIDTVIMGGFAANLCTDSHMRELVEQGFNVVMVEDAVGAPGEEAYDAAVLNYSMIANAVWTTDEAVAFLK